MWILMIGIANNIEQLSLLTVQAQRLNVILNSHLTYKLS